MLEDIKSFQPKLVILDAASDLFGGDENICTHRNAALLCQYSKDSKLRCFAV
ncbi:hypothetical protein [Wolbachia endosymbiont (group A) of Clivina fossor]|uniref:hypothetical protein n=1 Tax=Wolbachia endosymbiont (group A) of Clivina fossor TaxID=3066133 RepID=UPI003132F020